MALSAGDVLGSRYTCIRRLGGGGMGDVWLVVDGKTGTEVALKYCLAPDEEAIRRFAREVRAMSKVAHRNVMEVLDSALEVAPPYFVMPLATGSISEEMTRASWGEDVALLALKDMCAGIEATHASVGPHRDIKPLNALRMPDGRVVVSDFGLAKFEVRDTTVLTKTMQIVGTDAYMAPEQRIPGGSRDADAQTDVFQLGASAYHMLSGELPYLPDPARVDPGLWPILKKAMEPHPQRRYTSVRKFREAIEGYEAAKKSPKTPAEKFEACLLAVNTRLAAENKYAPDELRDLLVAVENLAQDAPALQAAFDRIPPSILAAAARDLPDVLEGALEAYCGALSATLGGPPYAYADAVANSMKVNVIAHTKSPNVKALAIRACLIAAVDLNRFDAMQAFDEMLVATKDDHDAAAVALMLREEAARYSQLAERVGAASLHPQIRQVRAENVRATT